MSESPSGRWALWFQAVTRIFAVVGGVSLFLGAVLLASRLSQDALAEEEQYTLPFSEIDCDPPPGIDRLTFLYEVWYLSEGPSRVNLLDRHLWEKLDLAFRKHPRVETLDSLDVTPDKRLRLAVRFRNS